MINDNVISELWENSNGRCMCCGKALERGDMVIDHIFPKRFGGADHIDNFAITLPRMQCDISKSFYSLGIRL